MTNKELAVQLTGDYLRGIYSRDKTQPLNSEDAKKLLTIFYEAVKSLPEND